MIGTAFPSPAVVFLLTAFASVFFFGTEAPAQSAPPPQIGAIRWDAWYDPADGNVAKAVEESLGPAQFHYRMPFFGKETGPDSVRINGDSQQIMDEEISLAAKAGLAYWAFCYYDSAQPMSRALRLYLSSAQRSKIAFCLIADMGSSISYFEKQTEEQIKLMQEAGYMKVLNGRPLFFFLSPTDEQIADRGGILKISENLQRMRSELQKSGHGNPYFVLSEGNPQRAQKLCHDLQLDAVGLYATCLGPFGGAPYHVLVQNTESHWNKLAASGLAVIPNVMTGWDTRPRLIHPVPWNRPKTPSPADHYYKEGRPEEIARHLAHAREWIKTHPSSAPANTALVYAWNECDEGYGALIPSYDPANPHGNPARIEAITRVLKP
jgi:hypothetical protein